MLQVDEAAFTSGCEALSPAALAEPGQAVDGVACTLGFVGLPHLLLG